MRHRLKEFIGGLLLLVAIQVLLGSCSASEDEPVLVNYYLALDSPVFIGITEFDEANGTIAQPDDHNIFMTYLKMKKALKASFPEACPECDDSRAIAACDSCYTQSMYSTAHGSTICTARLIRTKVIGTRIINSKQLKLYRFSYF